MFDTKAEWISHKNLKVSKDITLVCVDTRDFSIYTDTIEDSINISSEVLEERKEELIFSTQQVKSTINRLFKESGGDQEWRFLHFIDVDNKLIVGANWMFRILKFFKIDSNKWICLDGDNEDIIPKRTLELKVFGDIMESHSYSKKVGILDKSAEFDESQIDKFRNYTREVEIDHLKKQQVKDQKVREYKPKAKRDPLQRTSKKIHRNDPCPCGSGKKHKKCCLNKK